MLILGFKFILIDMEAIDFINDWNDRNIDVLDEQGNEYRCLSEQVENALIESNVLHYEDEDVILEYGFEFWCNEYRDNAKSYLNDLLENDPEFKGNFKPI